MNDDFSSLSQTFLGKKDENRQNQQDFILNTIQYILNCQRNKTNMFLIIFFLTTFNKSLEYLMKSSESQDFLNHNDNDSKNDQFLEDLIMRLDFRQLLDLLDEDKDGKLDDSVLTAALYFVNFILKANEKKNQ